MNTFSYTSWMYNTGTRYQHTCNSSQLEVLHVSKGVCIACVLPWYYLSYHECVPSNCILPWSWTSCLPQFSISNSSRSGTTWICVGGAVETLAFCDDAAPWRSSCFITSISVNFRRLGYTSIGYTQNMFIEWHAQVVLPWCPSLCAASLFYDTFPLSAGILNFIGIFPRCLICIDRVRTIK